MWSIISPSTKPAHMAPRTGSVLPASKKYQAPTSAVWDYPCIGFTNTCRSGCEGNHIAHGAHRFHIEGQCLPVPTPTLQITFLSLKSAAPAFDMPLTAQAPVCSRVRFLSAFLSAPFRMVRLPSWHRHMASWRTEIPFTPRLMRRSPKSTSYSNTERSSLKPFMERMSSRQAEAFAPHHGTEEENFSNSRSSRRWFVMPISLPGWRPL